MRLERGAHDTTERLGRGVSATSNAWVGSNVRDTLETGDIFSHLAFPCR